MSHEPTVPVKPHIAQAAVIPDMDSYREIYRESLQNADAYWAEQAAFLHWEKPWQTVSAGGFENLDFTWFAGGRLNACHNAVDRHRHLVPGMLRCAWRVPGELAGAHADRVHLVHWDPAPACAETPNGVSGASW